MKRIKLFEDYISEKREDVGKYNTVKKVVAKLGRRPSEQELAQFITDNYYDVTEVERGENDPSADEKIADLVAFYKFDIDDWEIAWADAQNESVVTEAKDMKFTDYLEILDKKFLDAMKAVRGDNGSDAAITPTRGDILQNFTLFRNYISSLTKKYKGDKTKLRFLTEKVREYESVINESVVTEVVDLVHVYDEDGKMFGTGELVKTKGKKSLIRWDGSKEEWVDSKLVKVVESKESDALAKAIDKAMIKIDDSMSYEDFALAVGKILKEEYGSHLFGKFMKVLHKDLGI